MAGVFNPTGAVLLASGVGLIALVVVKRRREASRDVADRRIADRPDPDDERSTARDLERWNDDGAPMREADSRR